VAAVAIRRHLAFHVDLSHFFRENWRTE